MRFEPITIIVHSPFRPPVVSPTATSKPHNKKKSERASDRSSSQRSPKHLKESATEQEMASTFNFLNKKSMVANCVVIELNDRDCDEAEGRVG